MCRKRQPPPKEVGSKEEGQTLDAQWREQKQSAESEKENGAHGHGLRVAEVPITIRYTDDAKRPTLKQGRIDLNGNLRLVRQYRPLMYFGVPGALPPAAAFVCHRLCQMSLNYRCCFSKIT